MSQVLYDATKYIFILFLKNAFKNNKKIKKSFDEVFAHTLSEMEQYGLISSRDDLECFLKSDDVSEVINDNMSASTSELISLLAKMFDTTPIFRKDIGSENDSEKILNEFFSKLDSNIAKNSSLYPLQQNNKLNQTLSNLEQMKEIYQEILNRPSNFEEIKSRDNKIPEYIVNKNEDIVGHVIGREWLMKIIDKFIADNSCGYWILKSEAGVGKTGFLVYLINERGYIRYFIEKNKDSGYDRHVLQSLSEQLVVKLELYEWVDTVYNYQIVPDNFGRLLNDASEAAKKSNKNIVLVVDAIDESGPWEENPLGLPKCLPKNVFVILSKKSGKKGLISYDTMKTAIEIYELRRENVRNEEDIKTFLREFAQKPEVMQALEMSYPNNYPNKNDLIESFCNTLFEKSKGVWIYLYHVCVTIKKLSDGGKPIDLENLPVGLDEYYMRYWINYRKDFDQWKRLYLPLISTLASINESISIETLIRLSKMELEGIAVRNVLEEDWGAFISILESQSSGEKEKYMFYHSTLIDFFEGKFKKYDERVKDNFIKDTKEAIMQSHSDIADYYLGLFGDLTQGLVNLPNKLDADNFYGIKHLAYHLHKAGRYEDLKALLRQLRWIECKLERNYLISLIHDYDYLNTEENVDEEYGLIQSAIQLSIHVINRDKTQLISQLYGRLIFYKDKENIRKLLDQIETRVDQSWLKPITPSLIPAGRTLPLSIPECDARGGEGKNVRDDRIFCISEDVRRAWGSINDSELKTQIPKGHTAGVNSAVVVKSHHGQSSQELLVVSASYDHTLRIWNYENGEELAVLLGHTAGVNAVAATPDGKYIVSASDDCTLVVWDIGCLGHVGVKTLGRHDKGVRAVAITSDGRYVISGSYDSTIRIWDLKGEESTRILECHKEAVNAVIVTQEADPVEWRIISGSHDKRIIVWNFKTGKYEGVFGQKETNRHTDRINSVAITSDKKYIISASHDKTLKRWHIKNNEACEVIDVGEHDLEINSVILVVDDGRAISASHDSTIKVWDLKNPMVEPLHTFSNGHEYRVNALVLCPDKKHFISASYDGTLKIWDLKGTKNPRTLNGVNHRVRAVDVSSDGKYAVSASYDHDITVWKKENGEKFKPLRGHLSGVKAAAITPDGKFVVSGDYRGSLRIWDLSSGTYITPQDGHMGAINAIKAINNEFAVSASDDGAIILWNLKKRIKECKIYEHNGRAYTIAADKRHIVSGSDGIKSSKGGVAAWNGEVKVWNIKDRKEEGTFCDHKDWVSAVAIDYSGKYAISASYDKTVKVWNIEDRKLESTFEGHKEVEGESYRVNRVVINQEGTVISASDQGTILFWNIKDREIIKKGKHDKWVSALRLSNDGKKLVSASYDCTIVVWNMDDQKQIKFTADSPITDCCIQLDNEGLLIIAGDELGQVHFLRLIECVDPEEG